MDIKTMIKGAVISAVAFSGMVACTANYLEINSNPYGVTDDEMQRDGYAVRAALVGMSNGVISPDVNTAQFTECLLGGTQGGYFADGKDVAGWPNTISNYNPTDDWTNVFMKSSHVIPVIYSNYRMLRQVTDDPVILAVGEIIKVAAMHRITDAYGPIPYSKIGENGEINVPYDSQEDVYKKMFEELNAAIEALTPNRTNNFSASADVVYGGNVEKWIKFANSLKLRLAMRVVYADKELAKEMAESAVKHEVGVMTSNDDNALFGAWGTNGNPVRFAVMYNMYSEGKHECITSGDSHAAADIIFPTLESQNPELYAQYLQSLKEYRDSEHKVMIAKFDNVPGAPAGRAEHINCLPDSVDYVILNNPDNLSMTILSEMKEIRQDKGMKTMYAVNYDAIEDEYAVYVEEWNATHTPEVDEFLGERTDYYLSLCDKYGYDGIVAGYTGIFPESLQEDAKAELLASQTVFFDKIKAWKESHPESLFFFEGMPVNMLYDTALLDSCDYIIVDAASVSTAEALTFTVIMAFPDGLAGKRIIVGVTMPSMTDETDESGYFTAADGSQIYAVTGAADWIVRGDTDIDKAGLCVDHAQYDYFDVNRTYRYIRSAIGVMNPSFLN